MSTQEMVVAIVGIVCATAIVITYMLVKGKDCLSDTQNAWPIQHQPQWTATFAPPLPTKKKES
jgi:hypothetical protein